MKRKLLKIFLWTGGILGGIFAILAIIVAMKQNQVFAAPYPELKASKDPKVIARGKYLVYGTAHCASCHTPNDKMEAVERGQEVPLSGGHIFVLPVGNFFSPNITPDKETGIGNLSDAELARSLRYGVGHDGHAMVDFMPFQHLSEEDMLAVISFLRSQKPVRNKVPKHELNPMGMVVKAFVFKPVGPSEPVPKTVKPGPTPEYGKYLAWSVANCRGCHTERDLKTGAFVGEDFAGGTKFDSETVSDAVVTTPNLTPDPKTGIMSKWTEEQFLARFRAGSLQKATVMPWGPFSRMTDDELKAIYRYLKTVKPVTKDVGPIVAMND